MISTRSRPQTPDRVQPRVENAISTVCLERVNTTSATVNGAVGGPVPMPGYRKLGKWMLNILILITYGEYGFRMKK